MNVIQFLSQTLAGRREKFTLEILALQELIDELLADRARMIHAEGSCGEQVAEDLCERFTQLDALAWQQCEEEKALRTLQNGLEL